METENEKDQALWRTAKKRVSFKQHLATYLITNMMLWLIWALGDIESEDSDFPWPIWPMLGWGIGLAFEYVNTYIFSKESSIEKEYRKLKTNKTNLN